MRCTIPSDPVGYPGGRTSFQPKVKERFNKKAATGRCEPCRLRE